MTSAVTTGTRTNIVVGPGQAQNPGSAPVRRKSGLTRSDWLYVLGPAIFLSIWEIVGRMRVLGNGMFPSFTETIAALLNWMFGIGHISNVYAQTWIQHVGVSSFRILVGFTIGAFLGVVLGALVGRFMPVSKLLDPLVNALRPISVTAWVPIALLLFGTGDQPAFFLTALATFFPVYVNTVDGVHYADESFMRAARMLGASERQVLFRVVLPAAMPSIFTGLKVAMAISWTTVVIVEALGAKSGVGYVLMDTYNQFLFSYVIAAMITIGLLGAGCNYLINLAGKPVLKWVNLKGKKK